MGILGLDNIYYRDSRIRRTRIMVDIHALYVLLLTLINSSLLHEGYEVNACLNSDAAGLVQHLEGGLTMKKSVLKWELLGILFISLVGALFHFVFEWSGESPVVGAFVAVNESVFEHLKLTFWPFLIWAAIEYRYINNSANNFIIAKTAGLYVMPVTIIVLFYSYTTITGIESLVADIAIFVVAIVLGQYTGYRLMTRKSLTHRLHLVSLVGMITLGVLYIVFTFYPPHVPFFQDAVSGGYGI